MVISWSPTWSLSKTLNLLLKTRCLRRRDTQRINISAKSHHDWKVGFLSIRGVQYSKHYVKQEISWKKIFGGPQILTINATTFAGLGEIPIYPFACWNLKPAKLWFCFCLSFAWFCAHLTLFAERYASESFFFFNFRHSPARVWEQCFKS